MIESSRDALPTRQQVDIAIHALIDAVRSRIWLADRAALSNYITAIYDRIAELEREIERLEEALEHAERRQ